MAIKITLKSHRSSLVFACGLCLMGSFAASPRLAYARSHDDSRLDNFEKNKAMTPLLRTIAGSSVRIYQPYHYKQTDVDSLRGGGIIVDKDLGLIATASKNINPDEKILVKIPRRRKKSVTVSADIVVVDDELGITILRVASNDVKDANEATLSNSKDIHPRTVLFYMGTDTPDGPEANKALVWRTIRVPLPIFHNSGQIVGMWSRTTEQQVLQVHNGRAFFMAGLGVVGDTAGDGLFDEQGHVVAIKHSEFSDAILSLIPIEQIVPLIERARQEAGH